MTRRAKINSASETSRIMASANKKILPPDSVPLERNDMPFFDAVIEEFPKADWTEHNLQVAAMLARAMCDMEMEQVKLRAEGSVAFSERGTPVVNPRKTVVQMLAGTILSMRRSLSLHARAQEGGRTEKIGNRKAIAKQAELNAQDEDDLIARPIMN